MWLAALCSLAMGAPRSIAYVGVNLAGAEFGEVAPGRLGVFGRDYIYPTQDEVRYFVSRGMNLFRIPFRWERLQPKPNAEFDAAEAARLRTIVRAVTSAGAVAVLDPHNYGRYYGRTIGSPEVPLAAFADFWKRLAREFGKDQRVWFGLMNEPH
ncbi:MAG: cellulase family glycosylhydrolase, partial [Fimbriimonadales bacterium]